MLYTRIIPFEIARYLLESCYILPVWTGHVIVSRRLFHEWQTYGRRKLGTRKKRFKRYDSLFSLDVESLSLTRFRSSITNLTSVSSVESTLNFIQIFAKFSHNYVCLFSERREERQVSNFVFECSAFFLASRGFVHCNFNFGSSSLFHQLPRDFFFCQRDILRRNVIRSYIEL